MAKIKIPTEKIVKRRKRLTALWKRTVAGGATLLKQPTVTGEQLAAILGKFNIGAFRSS